MNQNDRKNAFRDAVCFVLTLSGSAVLACDSEGQGPPLEEFDDASGDVGETEETFESKDLLLDTVELEPGQYWMTAGGDPVLDADVFPALTFYKQDNALGEPFVVHVEVGEEDWHINEDLPSGYRGNVKFINIPPGCDVGLYSKTSQNGSRDPVDNSLGIKPMYYHRPSISVASFAIGCRWGKKEFATFFNRDEYAPQKKAYLYAYYSKDYASPTDLPAYWRDNLDHFVLNQNDHDNELVMLAYNSDGKLITSYFDDYETVWSWAWPEDERLKKIAFRTEANTQRCDNPSSWGLCFSEPGCSGVPISDSLDSAFSCAADEGKSYCSGYSDVSYCIDPDSGLPSYSER